VIPQFLTGSTAMEVALGRYFFYGMISIIVLLYNPIRATAKMSSKIWIKALKFALVTNIVYYTGIILGLRYASPSVTALIIGLSPIAISIYGNFVEKTGNLKSIILPSIFIVLGLVLVNISELTSNFEAFSLSEYLFGLFVCWGCLGSLELVCGCQCAFPEIQSRSLFKPMVHGDWRCHALLGGHFLGLHDVMAAKTDA